VARSRAGSLGASLPEAHKLPAKRRAATAKKRPTTVAKTALPGKAVGAVMAAAQVLRALHESPRALSASEVARIAGLHRGTAYNILRTLQTEGFVAVDDETGTYTISLRILEMAQGALRKSGLMDLARPPMHEVADTHRVTVYLAKVREDRTLLLLDWVGAAFRTDVYVSVGRSYPSVSGASGVVIAAFSGMSKAEIEERFARVEWFRKPPVEEFLRRVDVARQNGFAIDRGDRFNGLTQVSAPILSSEWNLAMLINAVGHSHSLDDDRIDALSRDVMKIASQISDSLGMLRLT
jgi:DNA-binding IclR family transcriptional regulator